MSEVTGLGYYLPEKTLTNTDLEKMVNTSDEWIRKRTGIVKRHIAGPEEHPSDMGLKASLQALKQAGLKASDLDFIIVATLYPDQLMPNTACVLQHKLGLSSKTGALDISAACSGFVYAFTIAEQFIQSGKYRHILVVGTETLHRVTDYKDRSTCILFGDGAGAVILSQDQKPGCIHHHNLKAYGHLGSLLTLKNPVDSRFRGKGGPPPPSSYIQMEGSRVFKEAVQMMCYHYRDTLQSPSPPPPIDWIVPHQANARILSKFCDSTGFPKEKVIIDIHETGNTSAASIPICMGRAIEKGQIKKGQNILMVAMGGGMTSGSVFFKY